MVIKISHPCKEMGRGIPGKEITGAKTSIKVNLVSYAPETERKPQWMKYRSAKEVGQDPLWPWQRV